MHDRTTIDQIKERLLLSEVVRSRVRLTRKGKEFLGLCPFHGEKTPSFTVNDAKGFYHCFGCGAHGSIFDFLMHQERLDFPQALAKAASLAGVTLEAYAPTPERAATHKKETRLLELMEKAASWFQAQMETPAGEGARAYLGGRGVLLPTMRAFRMGFAPSGRHALEQHFKKEGYTLAELEEGGLISKEEDDGAATKDRFRSRLMFPITNPKGAVVGFGGRALAADAKPKYLNSPETPLFQKGALLYNYANALKGDSASPVLIVEGYLDVVALAEAGFPRVVAPLGTALTEAQLELAWRLGGEVILLMDGDQAGQKAQNRALERALPLLAPTRTLFFLDLPSGDDPDTFIRRAGKGGLLNLLPQKRSLLEQLWGSLYNPALLKTPEQRAFLETTLKQHTSQIKDAQVRYHYEQAIKARLFALNRWEKKPPPSVTKAPPLADFTLIQEKILGRLVLLFPLLLEEVMEDFFTLTLAPPLSKLQDVLLSYMEDDKPLETEALYAYLSQEGEIASLMTYLLTDTSLALHTPASRTYEEAKEAFYLVYETLSRKRLEDQYQQARADLKTSPTEAHWIRFQALMRKLVPNTGEDLDKQKK